MPTKPDRVPITTATREGRFEDQLQELSPTGDRLLGWNLANVVCGTRSLGVGSLTKTKLDLPADARTIGNYRRGQFAERFPCHPQVSDSTPPHSHSIILDHGNALISSANFFCAWPKTGSPIRQKFAVLISKGNFGDPKIPRFHPLSMPIGRFFEISRKRGLISPVEKDRQPGRTALTGRGH